MDVSTLDIEDDLREKLAGSCTEMLRLKNEWNALLTNYNSFSNEALKKVQDSYRIQLQAFESLCSEAESDERDQVRLANISAKMKADYDSLRRKTASCAASSRRKEAELIDSQRVSLLAGASPTGTLDNYLNETSAAATAAAASASSLSRTKEMLSAQVVQTGGILSVLGAGHEKLEATDVELRNKHAALLAEGRQSLIALDRQDQIERW
eukprot:CAMPEP_0175067674 /NCGR_PEP_ID=MMETSP0052_2-20121109/17233_1 /TAXON_ID=51329 ORGANISM="Polytomella parva, Strain SAG 63-3" /NCGR_SAMPLE_ID=MMETSP0052_2 /ASSEMBLY_ACC=CAM_ASM_000194 /LENGTH=209 /DNA_ID=CAMNT_0016334589 /DNA_START=23 /DNA_END=649 /DNA_ORIENTATION=+